MKVILLVGIALAVLQQWSGINSIFNYAEEIYRSAGYGISDIMFNSVITGAINFVFTLIAIGTVDHLGRRVLMLIGCAGIGVSHLLIGIAYALQLACSVHGANEAAQISRHGLLTGDGHQAGILQLIPPGVDDLIGFQDLTRQRSIVLQQRQDRTVDRRIDAIAQPYQIGTNSHQFPIEFSAWPGDVQRSGLHRF